MKKINLFFFTLSHNGYIWVLSAGIVVRMLCLQQAVSSNPLLFYPIVDAEVYSGWARAIVHSFQVIWPTPINYTPVYPCYLAFLFFVGNESTLFVFIVNLLLGAMQAILMGKAAEIVWNDRRVGLVCALLASFYWPFIIIESSFFAEPLALFCLALSLFLLVRWKQKSPALIVLLGSGFFLAIAALSRPHIFILFAPVTLYLLVRDIAFTKKRLRHLWLCCPGQCFVFVLPILFLSGWIVVANGLKTGFFQLRTMTSVNLFLGNDPYLDGIIVPPGLEWDAFMLDAVNNEGGFCSKNDDYWEQRTLAAVRQHWPEWLRLQFRKVFMHFGNFEISQELDFYYFRDKIELFRLFVWPGFSLILCLSAVGCYAGMRNRLALMLMSLCCIYGLGLFPFQAAARFRLPLVLMLCPFAGYGTIALCHALRRPWERKDISLLIVALLVYVFSRPDFTRLRDRNRIRNTFFEAKQLRGNNNPEEALVCFEAAMTGDPGDPNAPLHAGFVLLDQQRVAEAVPFFVASIERFPENPEAYSALAKAYLNLRQFSKAQSCVAKSLELYPRNLKALRLSRSIAIENNDISEAIRITLLLINVSEGAPSELFALALLYDMAGRLKEAISIYEHLTVHSGLSDTMRAEALFQQGLLAWQTAHDFDELDRLWASTPLNGHPLIRLYMSNDCSQFVDSVDHSEGVESAESCVRYLLASRAGDLTTVRRIKAQILSLPPNRSTSRPSTIYRWFVREETRANSQ
ncbi:MAG: tetratricopeptide repeat protein [Spartobacteria bacterium]|nr:tetratricopeptide repeat protein [Spartobacteria bacterium]